MGTDRQSDDLAAAGGVLAINADAVRRETRGVADVLVAPVAFLTNSDQLHRGYVPEDEIRDSAERWEGVAVTLGHPTDAIGEPVSVNDDDSTPVVGELENVEWDDDEGVLRGDAVLPTTHLVENSEGVRIMNALDSGRSVGVSASYYGANLPTGMYDGERRDEVKGDLRPDHVALLEDDTGRLGIRDGIGTGAVAANAEDTGPEGIATTVAAVEARQSADADAEADEGATTGIATTVTGVERRRRAENAGYDASEDGDEGADSFPSLSVGGRTEQRGDAERNGGERR